MKILSAALLSLSFLLIACEDPSASKPKAVTGERSDVSVANNTATVPAAAKGTALTITPANSKVLFTGSKVTGKHDGGFADFTGTIDLVSKKPEESSVSVEIATASVFADDSGLTGHLKSADFFDVEKFPKASFKSTKISPAAAGGYEVTGDLQLHGQTRPVTFPATITVGDDAVTVSADFSINRKDFGIVYAGKADDLIRDGVVIKLDLKTPISK